MSDRVPFLSPAAAQSLQRTVRRGFATVLALQEPAAALTLYRRDEGTGAYQAVGLADVAVGYDNNQPRDGQDPAYARVATQGRLRAYGPWDVRPGDRGELPDGTPFVIFQVPPERYGIQAALWRADGGSAR